MRRSGKDIMYLVQLGNGYTASGTIGQNKRWRNLPWKKSDIVMPTGWVSITASIQPSRQQTCRRNRKIPVQDSGLDCCHRPIIGQPNGSFPESPKKKGELVCEDWPIKHPKDNWSRGLQVTLQVEQILYTLTAWVVTIPHQWMQIPRIYNQR